MPLPKHPPISVIACALAVISGTCTVAAPDLKAECENALKSRHGAATHILGVSPVISATTGFAVDGMAEIDGKGRQRFTCTFGEDRKLQGLVVRAPD